MAGTSVIGAASEGIPAIGTIPISTMKSAPKFGFGKSDKVGEKPNPSPGPGSYPIITSIGQYVGVALVSPTWSRVIVVW